MDISGVIPVVQGLTAAQDVHFSNPIPNTAAPVITTPAPVTTGQGFDGTAADQKRYEAVQQMAENMNVYAVSDQSFTIFKDATGQYITRFTSLRDGRVTYVPEPQLVRMSSGAASTVQVHA